jgi:hypothetical protein
MRYVLIEVDDNEVAQKLMNKFENVRGLRIAGLFGPPTTWCGCPKSDGYHKDQIVRGGKLGWWVHRSCRRARKGTHQLTNLIWPADRSYGQKTGYVCIVDSVSIHEVPVQNLIPQVVDSEE